MGVLRWLLWPRRRSEEVEEEPAKPRRKHRTSSHPGVYRIEVDNELGRFRHDGPTFSFWASSRIILILSLLLWWIQPAGPMIAGYVGGRRAGAPWKAVLAALLPVFVILVANYSYAHNVAARQIDFVASLPTVVGDGLASILPFLSPYRDFMISYLQSFVDALRATFGMGTNGYLMVIIFAYIGGLIGEQTRRELVYRGGSQATVGLNLFQPLFGRRAEENIEEESGEDEDVPQRSRRPVRAGIAHAKGRGHRSPLDRLEDFRKIPAETVGAHAERRVAHGRRREDEGDVEEEEEDVVRGRRPTHAHAEARHEHVRAEREVEPPPRDAKEKRTPKPRSHEEEVAIQRFVERALRNYDRTKL